MTALCYPVSPPLYDGRLVAPLYGKCGCSELQMWLDNITYELVYFNHAQA